MSPLPPQRLKNLILWAALTLSLPVFVLAARLPQRLFPRATTPLTPSLATVRIHPGVIDIASASATPVFLSALAYNRLDQPVGSGVTYEWGISSTGSVGTLETNGNLATFYPRLVGRGDLWVIARSASGEATGSVPICLGLPACPTSPPPLPTPSPPPPSPDFSDVDRDGWSWKYIQQIVPLGIIPARTPTTFDPTGPVLRVDMAQYLLRTYEIITGTSPPLVPTPFTDIVDLSPREQEAIAKIYGLKITAGTSATTFSPQLAVDRAQMATFLSNLYKTVTGDFAPTVPVPFTDIGAENIRWARLPIARIFGLKVTAGISPTEFGPLLVTSREQMATFIFNFLRIFTPSRDDPDFVEKLRTVKGIVFYKTHQNKPSEYYPELSSWLPVIKDTGFNTVSLVSPWHIFNPRTNPPVYTNEFDALRRVLALFKQNGMRAILPLTYLGNGWSPDGIDYCRWTRDPAMVTSFETYVEEFLTQIADFGDMVYILLTTENAEPCDLQPYGDARNIASIMRTTLGSLPARLPPDLRQKFTIGYHDYSQSLGWTRGESPVQAPISFDFLSFPLYDMEETEDLGIETEILERVERLKAMYPFTPIILGETEASSCTHPGDSEENQARVLAKTASSAMTHGLGFSIWSWAPDSFGTECQGEDRGYGITKMSDLDGSLVYKQARQTLKQLLNPSFPPIASPTAQPTKQPPPTLTSFPPTTVTPIPTTIVLPTDIPTTPGPPTTPLPPAMITPLPTRGISPTATPAPTRPQTPSSIVCAQRLTPARQGASGVCRTFPDSCLPEGWVADSSCASPAPPEVEEFVGQLPAPTTPGEENLLDRVIRIIRSFLTNILPRG